MSACFAAVGLGAERIFEALLRSSLQGALFIAAVWLACRLLPRLPAAVRCGLWWAACLKLLVGLAWISPVELPLLPAAMSRPLSVSKMNGDPGIPISAGVDSLRVGAGLDGGSGARPALQRRTRPATVPIGPILFETFLLLWLAGLAALSAKALRQLRFTRRVIRLSEPVREGWIRAAFAELCGLLALRRSPELRASRDVRTPQAIGPRRPLVLLPKSGLARLSPAEVSMTLCHELVHLRRGDLWLGWVPALAHRIFFFHPLAALAAREYAIAREAACDAEVLRLLGTAPQAYGRLLLRWGVAPRETGLAAAGASPSLQNLKRRLQMLQQTSELTSKNKRRLSGWWWLAGAAVLAGLIPLRIVAQQPAPEAPPAEPAPEVAAAPEAPRPALAPVAAGTPLAARPALAPLPAAVAGPAGTLPTPRAVASTPAEAPPPAPPAPPTPPAPPAPPVPPAPPKNHGYSYRYSDDGDSWVLLHGNGSSTMSGSMGSLDKLKRLRGGSKEDILWYRHDGKEYVVRDAAVLGRAKEIFRPQMDLGARQGELGGRQGALGAKQGALGAEIAALAVKGIGRGGEDDPDLESRQKEIGQQMKELGRQQAELGRQQAVLGKQQAELGRQQSAVAEKAEKELRALMKQAIRSGAAQPIE